MLILALGMRAGFPRQPSLPIRKAEPSSVSDLPSDLLQYAMKHGDRRRQPFLTPVEGLTTAWDLTQVGLVSVGRYRPDQRAIAVVGSTAEDFALAVALDRMFGRTVWFPEEWMRDEAVTSWVTTALGLVALEDGQIGSIVTSVSLSDDDPHDLIGARWPEPVTWTSSDGEITGSAGAEVPDIVAATDLNLDAPHHLACKGDFDHPVTLPTRADGEGGFEFSVELPTYTPSDTALQTSRRPFWEVDAGVANAGMPTGHDLSGEVLLAGGPNPSTIARSGKSGISYNPENAFMAVTAATLSQAVITPRLRVPGLHEWIGKIVQRQDPSTSVRFSEAGRRAMIVTRLWGSRAAAAEDLLTLNNYFREFTASSSTYSKAYPEGDGITLLPGEGLLTRDAAIRTLEGTLTPEEIRQRVNALLDKSVLYRGLVISCSQCERKAFYRVDAVNERNPCPRCGAPAYLNAAFRSAVGDPIWYYDLHPAVREMLKHNGDVPFLAARALAKSARSYTDVAELDFIKATADRLEIDLIAVQDNRLLVAEAKKKPEIRPADLKKTITKMVHVSDVLGADEILLCTPVAAPWKTGDVNAFVARIRHHQWRLGLQPSLRVLTDLRGDAQITSPLP
jgi:hypothetical protein